MFSANTPDRLLLDIGTLTVGGMDVGATAKDGTFNVDQEVYFPEFGGARGPVAGTGKVTKETATLELSLMEIAVSILATVLPALSSASDANSEYTVVENIGWIGPSAHKTVIWTGNTVTGKGVQIQLLNALPKGGLKLNLNDDKESSYSVTFQAYYSTANPKQRCWQLYRQK